MMKEQEKQDVYEDGWIHGKADELNAMNKVFNKRIKDKNAKIKLFREKGKQTGKEELYKKVIAQNVRDIILLQDIKKGMNSWFDHKYGNLKKYRDSEMI
jgi:hypothetical protein